MSEDQVSADFDRARHKAILHELVAAVGRRPNDLIPYHELRRRLSPEGESYRGMRAVPVRQIVGSMDRYRDFDRAFLPRQRHTRARWKSIDRAYYQDLALPPIQLYQVGDVYFVKDGNHRVSVARQKRVEFIDAEVIEGHIRVPLYASMKPEELLLQAEYAEFLRRTNLDRFQPEHDIRPTRLGGYDEIWQQIRLHGLWLSELRGEEVGSDAVVEDWFRHIYCPIVGIANERGILKRFPHRTEADVYLWVMRHRHEIQARVGYDIGPTASAADYAGTVVTRNPLRLLVSRFRALARDVVS